MATQSLPFNLLTQSSLQAIMSVSHHRAIYYADLIFGAYALFSLGLVLFVWFEGKEVGLVP